MNEKVKKYYVLFFCLYLSFGFYSFFKGSKWIFDNLIALGIISTLYRTAGMTNKEFLFLNIIIVPHNLGSFGFYHWSFWIFQYDILVHIIAGFFGALTLISFFSRSFSVKAGKAWLIPFLILATVTFFGVMIEVIEYLGFLFFGSGGGVLFVGIEDIGFVGDVADIYEDTMTDMVWNVLGVFFGLWFWCVKKHL